MDVGKGEAFGLPRTVFVMLKRRLDVVRGSICLVERCFFVFVCFVFIAFNKFVDKSICRLKKLLVHMQTSFQLPCLGPSSFTFSLQKLGPNSRIPR